VRSDSAPFATLIADVPAEHENTLFQSWHDWFAWLAASLFAIVLGRVITASIALWSGR
jgi:apolipoprotein N-acyltransferase